MADTIEAALARRAAGQAGLFTRQQARQAGMSDDQLDRRVARGLYERVGASVFAVAGVAWTWERHARAALLGVGPLAYLSHRAAAHLLGFEGFGECPIEVTVPRGRRARTELAIVHTTTHLHPLDGIQRHGLPVTSGARTVIDLCASEVSEDQLGAAVGSSVRDGYTSEVFLRKRMASFRGSRGIRLLDLVLDGPIAHSYLDATSCASSRPPACRCRGLKSPSTESESFALTPSGRTPSSLSR